VSTSPLPAGCANTSMKGVSVKNSLKRSSAKKTAVPAPSGKLHTGQLPERRAHQDAALSAQALCPKKGCKLSGPRRGVHQGSNSVLLLPEHSPGSKWDTSGHSRIEGRQGLDHVGDGLQRCSGVSCGFPQAQPCVAKTKEACPPH
jgi:hypothetical protein